MSRRRRRHHSPSAVNLSAAFDSGERALIWIEMEPLLEMERQRCGDVAEDLEDAKREMERFRAECEPAYSRWFHSHFGAKVSMVRDLEARALELSRTVQAVEIEALTSGCSPRTAYARIEKMRIGAEKIDEMRSRRREENESGAGPSNPDEELPPEVEEFLKMGFEQMFGKGRASDRDYARHFEDFKRSFREDILNSRRKSSAGGDGENEEGSDERDDYRRSHRKSKGARPPSGFDNPRASEDPEEARRKRLYRDLARKLHPDVNLKLTQQEKELWHEVHAAYESKNLEQLETLAAVLESGSATGYSKITSVSRLRSIFQDFQKKLKATQKFLRQAKKDPAWNFTETERHPSKIQGLERRISRELREASEDLEVEISNYQETIDSWKNVRRGGRNRQASSRGHDLNF